MTLRSGFFNNGDADRSYSAEDFSNYLRGIVSNGFANLNSGGGENMGFKVLVNTGEVGGDGPSVKIAAGKAFMNGLWCINSTEIVQDLGPTEITAGYYHLLYLCFDNTEEVRDVSIGRVTGVAPVLPTDTDSTYYLPLAKVTNNGGAHPTEILDLRVPAGVTGVNVETSGIINGAVTLVKLGTDVVNPTGKLIVPLNDGAVTESMIGVDSVGMDKLKHPIILPWATFGAVSFHGLTMLTNSLITYIAPCDSRMKYDLSIVFDANYASTDRSVTIVIKKRQTVNGIPGGWVDVKTMFVTIPNHADGVRYIPASMFGVLDMTSGYTYEVAAWVSGSEDLVTENGEVCAIVSPR